MTVIVPVGPNNGNMVALQSKITALSARTDAQSQQEVNKAQVDLVSSLIDAKALIPATILSSVTYTVPPGNLIAGQITVLNALIAAAGTPPAMVPGLQAKLADLQSQLVLDLIAQPRSGVTAAALLASQTYQGGAKS